MDISFKDGVNYDNLKSIMFRAIFACAKVYASQNRHLVITSTNEGEHSEASFHYLDQAIDIRSRRIPKTLLPQLREKLITELHKISTDFQVILEDTHIHIELDRR
jgi:hypothetical protein